MSLVHEWLTYTQLLISSISLPFVLTDHIYRVHFVLAVFVSSPNLETDLNNLVVFYFSGTSVANRIPGKQAQAPFLEFLC